MVASMMRMSRSWVRMMTRVRAWVRPMPMEWSWPPWRRVILPDLSTRSWRIRSWVSLV